MLAPDPDRVGNDDSRSARTGLGVVEQPQRRQVEYDALARGAGEDVTGGEQDAGARPRQPRIEGGVGGPDLFIPEVVTARDINEGILLAGGDDI